MIPGVAKRFSLFVFACSLGTVTALGAQSPLAPPDGSPRAVVRPAQDATPAEPAATQEEPATDKPAKESKGAKKGQKETKQAGSEVTIESSTQTKTGDVFTYTGYVDARYQNIRLQADRVEYNTTNDDTVAEGNVVFDQGSSQRITARRAELNMASKLGTFYDATGFTDRTATGEFLYYTAKRIDKVAADEYVLYDADLTACEDSIPKWSLKSKQARLTVNDRVRLHNAVFDIKGVPVFWLPYASIPIDRKERQSGFLLPRFGNSSTKGFTYSQAYYQTLGRSADATFRTDYFSSRGLGFGFEFRARTDERSGIRLGTYIVKDRLWGDPGPDQGGSAFFLEGVQYLPHGWVAVADARITSNLAFRRTFSDTYEEIINPQERSTLYFNNNYGRYSFNLLAEGDSTTINQQNIVNPDQTTDVAINIRHLPSVEVLSYDRPLFQKVPLYFSFDAAAEGLRRIEKVGDVTVFRTPNMVQRFDLYPKFTLPLPFDMHGWAITPSLGLRTTFYSNSLNPAALRYNPNLFTLDPNDPRILNPPLGRGLQARSIELFDPLNPGLVESKNLSRNYLEFAVEIRPPVLGRVYYKPDGEPNFKHVIEPYVIYRRLAGISQFDETLLFDERDAIADTNEVEYGITNRFFVTRHEKGAGKKQQAESESADDDDDGDDKTSSASGQPHELLSVTVRQKYFLDPTFGGAFHPIRRNQFYPIDTFSGFGYGGIKRRFSPINIIARARPLSALFADLNVDYDVQRNGFKDLAATGGARGNNWQVSEAYFFSRTFRAKRGQIEPGTFSGNQWITAVDLGNLQRGVYGGTRLNIDFTDRFDPTDLVDQTSSGRIVNSRTYLGYAWDCCGVQFNVATYNLPQNVRDETQFYFTFTLGGIGSIGNENIGQPTQTRRISRGRVGRGALDLPEDR